MTQMHEQRYATSSVRNAENFLARGGRVRINSGGTLASDVNYPHFAGMEMDDLKHHVGLRKNDSKFDGELSAWLGKVKDHATKAGIAAKSRKKIAPTVVSELQEGQTILDLTDAVDTKPQVVAEPRPKKFDEVYMEAHGSAEKKINPKKAERQAAASDAGPVKKINADTARAEAMAGKAKRTPRIMAKTSH
jgi:hypothetical protein